MTDIYSLADKLAWDAITRKDLPAFLEAIGYQLYSSSVGQPTETAQAERTSPGVPASGPETGANGQIGPCPSGHPRQGFTDFAHREQIFAQLRAADPSFDSHADRVSPGGVDDS